ncbi:MAG: metalloregulator ArsR/SmtB family transcription factor [Candidatus Micrarchaeota archaeon]
MCTYEYMDEAIVFKALSDPARIEIIKTIAKEGGRVGLLGKKLGKSQPNISQHLRILRLAGIVKSKRNGKQICYCLRDKKVLRIIESAGRLRL